MNTAIITAIARRGISGLQLNTRPYTAQSKPTLSFKQFIQRGKVLAMYRKYMRLLKQIPDKKTRKEMREWIRFDFDKYRSETDSQRIEVLIGQANRQFKEMQSSIFSAV
ncbi:LYR motif-containing protein 2 [Coemansia sp. BCRC 34490]|nr:LYR motif-containing protein 2 [Coemansia sp. BCRC 34490]